MSSQEQETTERGFIIAYIRKMMEFFNLSGTFDIKEDWDEYNGKNGYFISFSDYRNFILFQKIDLINLRRFIEDIVGYNPRKADFPPVKSIHDLYLVITKLYIKYRKIGMSSFTENDAMGIMAEKPLATENNGFPRYHIGQSVMVDLGTLINQDIRPDVRELHGKVAKITNVRPFGKSYQYELNNGPFWIIENKLLPILDNYKDTKFSIIKVPSIISLNFNY